MIVPAFQYGLYRDVLAQCKKRVSMLRKGITWSQAVGVNFVNTSDDPGMIILYGPSSTLGSSKNYHLYILHSLVFSSLMEGQIPESLEESIFEESLSSPWSVLGLLARANTIWIQSSYRRERLLNACVLFWDVLASEGSRYSIGSNSGSMLWSLPTNLQYILANFGVPISRLQEPLSENGLADLLVKPEFPTSPT